MLQMLSKTGPQQRSSLNNPLLTMLQNSGNPQQIINNLITQNPQINNLINQYGGGDPKTAFYEYARLTGQDPNQVLSALKNFLGK